MRYYGWLMCKKCKRHMDWGTKGRCPCCGHDEGEPDE